MIPSYEDIIEDKKLSKAERLADLEKLKAYKADTNERKFCGNPYLYHYQLDNLCRTALKSHASLHDVMTKDEEGGPARLYAETIRRERTGSMANRMFECHRVNRGSVVFFKPSTAKWIYKKFGATSVLDPTAGWGGRLLGAWALGIKYTGFDTNEALLPAYQAMLDEMPFENPKDYQLIFQDCLEADFSKLSYDFVLTSPPYINLELYEGMTPFANDAIFYCHFLIPLLDKCLKYCKKGGWVCFNISPKMFKDLMARGYKKPDEEHDLLQQKRVGKDKGDKIYCWRA